MTRILAALALVLALGGLTACDPEQLVRELTNDGARTPGAGPAPLPIPLPISDEPAPGDPPISDVPPPAVVEVEPAPTTTLPDGAVDPGDGSPIIWNPGEYTICNVITGECVTYGPG